MWPWKLQLTFIIWRPYVTSWSKRSLSRCVLLDRIWSEWRLVRYYFKWVWVILGGWGWVGVYGALFLGGWEWVEVGALFDNARNIFLFIFLKFGKSYFQGTILFFWRKIESFWNKKSKDVGQIKPCFPFWLKINFRKKANNKHVDLRKIENPGTPVFSE